MTKEVTKKNGTKEPFDAEKIKNSIRAAAKGTSLSEERKNGVVEQVAATIIQMAEGRDEIATLEIKEKILSELDTIEPAISAEWRKYDQEKEGA